MTLAQEKEKEATKLVWTVAKLLAWATQDFKQRGIENPRLDAEVIVSHSLHTTRTKLITEQDRLLDEHELTALRDLIKRRRAFEPVAYLLGRREFYGYSFLVDKRVLIPRPDTETLVDVALKRTQENSLFLSALDLCTGSGCVGVSLAKQRPCSQFLLTDLSSDALLVAESNALRLGAYNVGFLKSDLFSALDKKYDRHFDLIVTNPPYIPKGEIENLMPDVSLFEPHMALDGGEDGLEMVRQIVVDAKCHLAFGALLALEVGSGQAQEISELFMCEGYTEVQVAKDYGRVDRVVSGRWLGTKV